MTPAPDPSSDSSSDAAELRRKLETVLHPSCEVQELLGRGGMGSVFKAWQRDENRHVAIKTISATGESDTASLDQFEEEARALAHLSHPHIVFHYDFGRIPPDTVYLIMEYVPGSDLFSQLNEGTVSQHQFLSWILQICAALNHIHSAGLVHRDIKPSNILINTVGSVKVIDFGLARFVQAPVAGNARRYQSVGTPEYAAPEALKDGALADHRADVFSVGVMIYEALCGKRPQYPYIPPSLRQSDLDPEFDLLVARALQNDPDKRFQSIADLRAELQPLFSRLA